MEDTPHLPRSRKAARSLTAALLIPTLAPFAPAAPPAPPNATSASWQTQATAAQLTPAHIEQLARDKLLIGPQTHRQIFTPYTAPVGDKVRFITSDAALAAYHALFEDSFRELELRRAYTLRGHLHTLLKLSFLNADPARIIHERALIQHILGPALIVLGAPLTDFDEKLRPEIERQAALIRTAESIELPEWLGPPSRDLDSLDYRRCKPVSFYVGQPALENYFRAMRWLQLVPLRADRDTELTAWALLAVAISENKKVLPQIADYFSSLNLFVGPQADRGLVIGDDVLLWRAKDIVMPWDLPKALKTLRQHLLDANADAPLSSINDERRERPSTARDDASRLANIRFRIAPTFALPDAELISQALDAKIRPNGLMIAALLGSSFAEERMPKVPAADWATWKKSARALTLSQDGAPRSLYADYFDTLRTLNTPPVENAPAFMRSPAWQAKTVQTQLASWAQARHTYTLQAKLSVTYFGAMANDRRPPPGFVEPNPTFWREYTRLVERTSTLLKDYGVFTTSAIVSAARLREAANLLEKQGLHLPTATRELLSKVSDEFDSWRISGLVRQLGNKTLFATNKYASDEALRADVRQTIDFLNESAAKIESGQMPAIDVDSVTTPEIPLADRWQALTTLARQLETIVVKQIDETELNDADRIVLILFGQRLAHCMGYFASSSKNPRDDAPRWAEVAHDVDADQSLGIGTSRAQTIHVLYPWHGEELLCVGAVLPYFEEWAPTKRLTDDEWKQKLDSPAAPPPPTWIQPLLAR
jgi:hypothetical protein